MSAEHKPFIAADVKMREFTVRAVILGMILSVLLGAANAYLGLKVGLTVAATFPAAVIAMAVLRMFRGTILEENTCRTTAAVGEALAAGAIFTVPAFLIAKSGEGQTIWTDLKSHYLEATVLMLLGGVLGVLFVTFLRRVLMEDKTLPFPESKACAAIVKAGQRGQTGAKYVFGALGLGALVQLLKNAQGLRLFKDSTAAWYSFKSSSVSFMHKNQTAGAFTHKGGMYLQSPEASPAMMSVGYIIGPRLAAIVFAGGVLAWFLFVPLILFLRSQGLITEYGFDAAGQSTRHLPDSDDLVSWAHIAAWVWKFYVRPLAVGAMIVAAFHTLWKMRTSLWVGIKRAVQDIKRMAQKPGEEDDDAQEQSRLEKDFPLGLTALLIVALVVPIAIIYYYFCGSVIGAVVAAIVMTLAGFLFAAVAGFLVGTIGSSNNPISGLTLSTLVVAALLMLIIGVKGAAGIAAVLGVATVVCCSSGVAGDIMQDLKVGHILGGTPWKMELGCILGVVAAALIMVLPLMALHQTVGIGSADLPAPQAGLMAMLSQGIISQKMAWPLVGVGAAFAVAMILIQAPSPMLIAIGMYLPFTSTAPIFLGGITRWILEKFLDRRKVGEAGRQSAENTGTLLASGLIAGEAIMGIGLAAVVLAKIKLPVLYEGAWPGLLVILGIAALLIFVPFGQANSADKNPPAAQKPPGPGGDTDAKPVKAEDKKGKDAKDDKDAKDEKDAKDDKDAGAKAAKSEDAKAKEKTTAKAGTEEDKKTD
jgi:putative OPT family oligopeptide transporter